MEIDFLFIKLLDAIGHPQLLANESLRLNNFLLIKDLFDKERIIIKYLDTIVKTWQYIDNNENVVIVYNKKSTKLRALIDSVFKPLISPHKTVEKWLENYTSEYFLHFIQGITLFQDYPESQAIEKPAYHRISSCGPKNADDTYNLKNINCKNLIDAKELFRRRRNSWNCYLERKIYDEMYKKILNKYEQNFGHRFQMKHIEVNNFESFFPLMYFNFIQISMQWSPDLIPISVELKYKIRETGNFRIVIEKYSKTFVGESYLNQVNCSRFIEENDRIATQHMIQSVFKQNIQWTSKISSGGGIDISRKKETNNLQSLIKCARNKRQYNLIL